MNRSYRNVWNQVTGTWVAVSELTRARGKRASGLAPALLATCLVAATGGAGAQVVINFADGSDSAAALDTSPPHDPTTLNSLGGGLATQSGDVSGTGAVVKTGAGTIVLNGANSYQGSTSILQGTIRIDSDARLGSGGNLILDGGTLGLSTGFTSSKRAIALGTNGGNHRGQRCHERRIQRRHQRVGRFEPAELGHRRLRKHPPDHLEQQHLQRRHPGARQPAGARPHERLCDRQPGFRHRQAVRSARTPKFCSTAAAPVPRADRSA